MTPPPPGPPAGGVGVVALYNEDNRVTLGRLPDASVDSVVTDPPYELDFMSRGWDRTGIAYDAALWREVCRVLKPGGHLLAFGGTRTYHRMVCAIEDAGFEIRDTLQWLYGSGFPKSLDIGKELDRLAGLDRAILGHDDTRGHYDGHVRTVDNPRFNGVLNGGKVGGSKVTLITAPASDLAIQWDGWGTALKPAHEPIVLARKPLSEGTVAANVARWGTGGLNIAACRIGTEPTLRTAGGAQVQRQAYGTYASDATSEPIINGSAAGRWPSNLVLSHTLFCREVGTRQVKTSDPRRADGTVNASWGTNGVYGRANSSGMDKPRYATLDGTETIPAWECAPGCPVALLDSQSGQSVSTGGRIGNKTGGIAVPGGHWQAGDPGYGDTGGASRFYPVLNYTLADYIPWLYQAKASRAERNAGCESLPFRAAAEHVDRAAGSAGMDSPRAGAGRTAGGQNHHPTVKPVALLQWLIRLITPPGGTVLDPFMGSGTGAVAAIAEGVGYIGAELDTEHGYFAIAEARRAWALAIADGRDPLAPALWGPLFAALGAA